LLLVGPMTKKYGWSSVWYFMMALTVCGTGLMGPKIVKEIRGEEGDKKNTEKGSYQARDVKV